MTAQPKTDNSPTGEGGAPFLTLLTDQERKIVDVDGRPEELLGRSREELLGERFDALLSRRDRKARRSYNQAIVQLNTGFIDLRVTLDGKEGQRLCRLRLGKQPQGWLLVLEDLLSPANARILDLEERGELWKSIVASSDEGIVVLDEEHRITEINDEFVILGALRSDHGVMLNEEGVLGRVLSDILPDTFTELWAALARGRTKKRHRFSTRVTHAGRRLKVSASPIHLPVRGYVGASVVFRDETSQWRLEEVSEALREKNTEIQAVLENIQQGIFSFGGELEVCGVRSRHLPRILGREIAEDENVLDLLFEGAVMGPDERGRIESVLSCSFFGGMITYDMNEHLLPREVERQIGGNLQVLEVDWTPIVGACGDEIVQIMVTLRDVTELRQLRNESARQQQEIRTISEVVRLGSGEFRSFVQRAEESLYGSLRAIETIEESAAQVFRDLHTLKGLSRLMGLSQLADPIHLAEDSLSARRAEPNAPQHSAELRSHVEAALAAVQTYVDAERQLRPGGAQIEHEAAQARALLEVVQDRTSPAEERLARVQDQLQRSTFVPLRGVLRAALGKIPAVARELGRATPEIVMTDVDCRVDGKLARALTDVFVHLTNNALDHGIEPPRERESAGKPERGQIRIQQIRRNGVVVLRVADDGRGLDLGAFGPSSGDREDLADRVFLPGFTTKRVATQISGRGVGLNVVRERLVEIGGNARLHLFDDGADGRVPFAIDLQLPGDRILDAPNAAHANAA